jgi:HPr kinase/phosphorylase
MNLFENINIKHIESVSVRDFYDSFKQRLGLNLVAGKEGIEKLICERSVNRPALALIGCFHFFGAKRLQLFGAGEMAYLRELGEEQERKVLEPIFQRQIPCVVISRNLAPSRTFREIAEKYATPIFRTKLRSKNFTVEVTIALEEKFAPSTSLHGTLLDVKGIGVIITGESGVGKSECALALIERGHSLVADDIVHIKRISEHELLGHSSNLGRGYMECRGIGIINVAQLFGVRSVRLHKRLDLIIQFVLWKPGMFEERTGLEENFVNILGLKIPTMEIPVRPGRDMARLVEVAALVQTSKLMGHNPAEDFNQMLIANMAQDISI